MFFCMGQWIFIVSTSIILVNVGCSFCCCSCFLFLFGFIYIFQIYLIVPLFFHLFSLSSDCCWDFFTFLVTMACFSLHAASSASPFFGNGFFWIFQFNLIFPHFLDLSDCLRTRRIDNGIFWIPFHPTPPSLARRPTILSYTSKSCNSPGLLS